NPVGASSLAMVVNDNAGWQVPRGALGFIASKPAPTDGIGRRRNTNPVGASSLAMVVNDNAGWQVPRGALGFIASRLAPTSPHMGYYTHLYHHICVSPGTPGNSLFINMDFFFALW
ncbi:hypothetical protein QF013_005943, partial [Pseudomonas laurylsulfatiphila]